MNTSKIMKVLLQ